MASHLNHFHDNQLWLRKGRNNFKMAFQSCELLERTNNEGASLLYKMTWCWDFLESRACLQMEKVQQYMIMERPGEFLLLIHFTALAVNQIHFFLRSIASNMMASYTSSRNIQHFYLAQTRIIESFWNLLILLTKPLPFHSMKLEKLSFWILRQFETK